jgi:hypothetical protein
MKKDGQTFRFAVGSPETVESWIWRLWIHRDEVYLGARDALRAFKVSLHQSGIWRIAFVADLERSDKSDRVITKWKRPGEFAPGWTPSVGVLISSVLPVRPFKTPRITDNRVTWFDRPVAGNKLLFKILFSKGAFTTDDARKITTDRDRLAACLVKQNGEKVWLVVRDEQLAPIEEQKVRDVMLKTKIHLKPGSEEDSVASSRALLVVSEERPGVSNQPTILDISLGKENLAWDTA